MELYIGESSKLVGKTVKVISGAYKGSEYIIEDWWIKVSGKSWMSCDGNPACLDYTLRGGLKDNLPNDNHVYYGKIDGFGKLIHASEIEE